MSFLSGLFGSKQKTDFKELVQHRALVVDVRSEAEYAAGHIKASIHIPLGEIQNHIPELKAKNRTIITCCRSGSRSGIAKSILSAAGVQCFNGGPWQTLNKQINQ